MGLLRTENCHPDPTLSSLRAPTDTIPPTSPTNSFQCAPPIRGHFIFLARIAARMLAVAAVVGIAFSAARRAVRGPSVDKLIRPGCG